TFQFDTIPNTFTAGDSFRIVVTARDAGGSIYPYSGGATIKATRSDHFSYKIVNFNNGYWRGNVLITLADTIRLRCEEPGGRYGISGLMTGQPNAPARLLVLCPNEVIQPGAPGVFNSLSRRLGSVQIQTAGYQFSITVYLTDIWTNPVNFGSDTIVFSSSDNFALIPMGRLNGNGQGIFSATLRTALVSGQRIFASDRNRPGIGDTSSYVPVVAGNFSQLLVLLPNEIHLPGDTTTQTINTPGKSSIGPPVQYLREFFPVTVYAVDSCWNRTSAPQDTIVILSNFPDTVVPPKNNLTNGQAGFQVAFLTAGDNQNIWARDLNNGIVSYPTLIKIEARTAKMNVDVVPDTVLAGQEAEIRVNVLDLNDSPIKGKLTYFRVKSGSGRMIDSIGYTDSLGFIARRFICELPPQDEIDTVQIMADTFSYYARVFVSILDTSIIKGRIISYPNPFGHNEKKMVFIYYLPQACNVLWAIYDPFGNLIKKEEIMPGARGARMGANVMDWDGKNEKGQRVASGVYVLKLKAWSHTNIITKKEHRIGVIW
ncbi:MAG: FlgD immunoglobulin-like domain containing protein, partial [candidate division WOR-3 bacterium]